MKRINQPINFEELIEHGQKQDSIQEDLRQKRDLAKA